MPLLKNAPQLMAITILRKLQEDHPERFPDGVLRTLQRRIRQWRALQGPPKEVFFPQDHAPGQPRWFSKPASPKPVEPEFVLARLRSQAREQAILGHGLWDRPTRDRPAVLPELFPPG